MNSPTPSRLATVVGSALRHANARSVFPGVQHGLQAIPATWRSNDCSGLILEIGGCGRRGDKRTLAGQPGAIGTHVEPVLPQGDGNLQEME